MFLRSCACGSEEHTSELQHLGISYAVFCLKKKILIRLWTHQRPGFHIPRRPCMRSAPLPPVGLAPRPAGAPSHADLCVSVFILFFFNYGAPPDIYSLPLPDALPF